MAADDDTILRVTDLSVRLDGRAVLTDLSFTVTGGEILTILGPNGAGKTVLLKTLLGLLPHDGSVVWRPGTRLGYVPQRLPYIRDLPLSVEDFFRLRGPTGPEVGPMLQAVGLAESVLQQRIGGLSSGQFQRVLIAWALAGDPQVLLFDEPTTGVDVGGEETVYRLLARLHRERHLTILLITHDLSVVYDLSTTVLCLNRHPVCHGPPVDVLTPERLHQLYGADVKYYRHRPE